MLAEHHIGQYRKKIVYYICCLCLRKQQSGVVFRTCVEGVVRRAFISVNIGRIISVNIMRSVSDLSRAFNHIGKYISNIGLD